jgi:hypothetical protein
LPCVAIVEKGTGRDPYDHDADRHRERSHASQRA